MNKRVEWTNLNNSWPSGSRVVCDSLVTTGKHGVGLSTEARWYRDGKPASDWSRNGEGWAGDGDEGSIDGGLASSWLKGVSWSQKSDCASGLDRHNSSWVKRQGWEGLDRECRIARRASGDEPGCQGIDIIDTQRSVKWLRKWGLLERAADVRGVTRLDGKNRAGRGKIVLAHDVGSSTEVGRDANTFQNGSCCHKQIHACDTEGIRALGDWSCASSYQKSVRDPNLRRVAKQTS